MDVDKLTNLWVEDGVLLGQGDEPLVGKAAIEASLKQNFAASPTMKVLQNTCLRSLTSRSWGIQPMSGAFST
jgi:hypothetical protein